MVELLGLVGTLLNILYVWPQAFRMWTSSAGVSLRTALLGYLARFLIALYAVQVGDAWLLAGQVPPAAAFGLVVARVAADAPAIRRRQVALLLPGASLAGLVCAWAPHPVLEVTGVLVASVVSVPQLLLLAGRARTGATARGVSMQTYVLGSAASLAWLSYGVAVADAVIWLPHVLLLPTTAAVAWCLSRQRRPRRPPRSGTPWRRRRASGTRRCRWTPRRGSRRAGGRGGRPRRTQGRRRC